MTESTHTPSPTLDDPRVAAPYPLRVARGVVFGLLVPALATATYMGFVDRAQAESSDTRRSYETTARDYAALHLARQALPEGYVDARLPALRLGKYAGERELEGLLRKSNPLIWDEKRSSAETAAREGFRAASDAGLADRDALERSLRSSPTFDRRYRSDSAFRHGVDAALWAAQRSDG